MRIFELLRGKTAARVLCLAMCLSSRQRKKVFCGKRNKSSRPDGARLRLSSRRRESPRHGACARWSRSRRRKRAADGQPPQKVGYAGFRSVVCATSKIRSYAIVGTGDRAGRWSGGTGPGESEITRHGCGCVAFNGRFKPDTTDGVYCVGIGSCGKSACSRRGNGVHGGSCEGRRSGCRM